MHFLHLGLFLILLTLCPNPILLVHGQPVAGECETAPHWTVEGRNVMSESRGNVTLVALMELHCSFCRSQIEGFVALSKMLKNQSVNEVQFVIIAPWNESAQYVDYFRQYLEPTGIKVFQETITEPVWSKLKGNKDDFLVYDACGRLSYYIPYPQSYLYYHYTVSTLYSTLRQEKCGSCRFIAALERDRQDSKPKDDCSYRRLEWQLLMKVRAYLNVMSNNATTHYHYLEHTDAPRTDHSPDAAQVTPAAGATSVTTSLTSMTTKATKRKPIRDRKKGRKTTTTTTTTTAESITWPEESGEELEPTTSPVDGSKATTAGKATLVTPLIIDVLSGEEHVEEGASEGRRTPDGASPDSKEPTVTTSPSSGDFGEGTAQIPATTIGTSASAVDGDSPPEEAEYEDEEYEEPADGDLHLKGGGAVGSVGAPVVSVRRRLIRKRLNGTKAAMTTIASIISPTTVTSTAPTTTTTAKPITTSWSTDPKAEATTESANFGRKGWGTTRVPKLSDDVDCTPYTTSMCYRQWQEFGTLHPCCQRGVYLTDLCKVPLCNNATFHLCCFQKYQQARFQCCYDSDLAADRPDDFSRCCYNHFVYDDDGNGDNDDQCCPKAMASYFWTTQTRVAELCLPNVELDLDGIVLEARMSDKTQVRIPLQESTALQYECPYVDKRHDFFYWEPDSSDDGSKLKPTTPGAGEIDIPE